MTGTILGGGSILIEIRSRVRGRIASSATITGAAMENKGHVAINMSGSGSLDVALAREEALHRFRDINWATYTRYLLLSGFLICCTYWSLTSHYYLILVWTI